LQHSIKQPESNPDLFYFIETSLKDLDKSNASITANVPLFFSLKLGEQLGFEIQGNFTLETPILDLQEGYYIKEMPIHPYFIEGNLASLTTDIIKLKDVSQLDFLKLNKTTRRQLIEYYIQYFSLHISNFLELRSLEVLKEVLE
jgi:DNA repair protein RecO (recombination protein O)